MVRSTEDEMTLSPKSIICVARRCHHPIGSRRRRGEVKYDRINENLVRTQEATL